jgi:type IV secretory pathway VirB10-like protein
MMQRAIRWRLGLAALALAVPLLFLACNEEETAGSEPTQIGLHIVTTTPAPTPEPTLPPEPTESATPEPTPVPNVCPENPSPAEPNVMVVEEPQPDAHLTSPTHVRGWGVDIGFEKEGVHVAVYDSTGEPLKEMTGPPLPTEGRTPPPGMEVGEFTAPFAVDIAFRVGNEQPGCVRVYEISPRDGHVANVVQFPVLLQP